MIHAMLARLFRILDRFGWLLIRVSLWLGGYVGRASHGTVLWLRERTATSALQTDSAHIEGQVRSLSGLTVMLLAAVALLILWTTAPEARNNPVVRFLPVIGATPLPGSDVAQAARQELAPPQEFLDSGGAIVFAMYVGYQTDLFVLAAGQSVPVRLTDSPADERDPAWSPDGQHIAFASRRDGNWELYTLDLPTGEVSRLTYDLAYEAAPSWSPDGQWIAYEAYYEGNLDIYITKADGSEGPYPLTRQPGPDYAPAWATGLGREIAYVSLREGNRDIYLLSLDDPSEERAVNLTGTRTINEGEPAWGPGGTLLAYSAVENGIPLVYVMTRSGDSWSAPAAIGQGQSPAWSPDGRSLVFVTDRPEGGSLLLTGQVDTWVTSLRAFATSDFASSPDWSAASLPAVPRGSLAFAATAPLTSAYEETLVIEPQEGSEAPYRLVNLQALGVIAEAPYLSDRVDGSFIALRDYMDRAAGWDFLGQLDSVYWDLLRPVEPGLDYRNWHKAGRAFDIAQVYAQGNPAQIELIPEMVGPDMYWRVYVRCAIQDGTLGEPLHDLPWDFSARYAGDIDAYENGGRFKNAIPSGYYVDFTGVARLFGWYRVPSNSSWRYNWPGVLFWQYEKRDGLDWWSAMLEIYPERTLAETFGTPTPGPASVNTSTAEPTPGD